MREWVEILLITLGVILGVRMCIIFFSRLSTIFSIKQNKNPSNPSTQQIPNKHPIIHKSRTKDKFYTPKKGIKKRKSEKNESLVPYLSLPVLESVGFNRIIALGLPREGVAGLLAAVGVAGEVGGLGQAWRPRRRGGREGVSGEWKLLSNCNKCRNIYSYLLLLLKYSLTINNNSL